MGLHPYIHFMLFEHWHNYCAHLNGSLFQNVLCRRIERCYMHAFRTYIFAKAYTRSITVWLR